MSRLPHDLSWVVYPKINPTYMYMYMYTSFTMSWYICIKIWMTSDRNKEVWARDLYHSTALLNIIGHVRFMAHGIRPHSTMHGATQHKQGIVKLTKTSNTLQTKNRICNDRHNTKIQDWKHWVYISYMYVHVHVYVHRHSSHSTFSYEEYLTYIYHC